MQVRLRERARPAGAGAAAGASCGRSGLRGFLLGCFRLRVLPGRGGRPGAAAGAAAAPEPMTARTEPTSAVSSSLTRISCRVPATGDGISVSTLSVETSSSGSSTSTVSPTALSQRVTVPSVTLSPRAGRVTSWPSPPPAAGAFGGRCLGGGCFLRRVPLRPGLPRRRVPLRPVLLRVLLRRRGAAAGAVADADQRSADLGGLVFGNEDFLDDAGDRRGDFGVYFVGGDLEQRLVHLYPVTYLLEPAGDGSFGDALTEGGQVNGFRHVVPVLLIDLCADDCCLVRSLVHPAVRAGCTRPV